MVVGSFESLLANGHSIMDRRKFIKIISLLPALGMLIRPKEPEPEAVKYGACKENPFDPDVWDGERVVVASICWTFRAGEFTKIPMKYIHSRDIFSTTENCKEVYYALSGPEKWTTRFGAYSVRCQRLSLKRSDLVSA